MKKTATKASYEAEHWHPAFHAKETFCSAACFSVVICSEEAFVAKSVELRVYGDITNVSGWEMRFFPASKLFLKRSEAFNCAFVGVHCGAFLGWSLVA